MVGHTCGKPSCTIDAHTRCAKCHVVYYCSKECQVANWKAHKKVCKEISNGAKLIESNVRRSTSQWSLDFFTLPDIKLISQVGDVESYKLVKIPGKGFGAVATRDINFGELFLKEKPIIQFKECVMGLENGITTKILNKHFIRMMDFHFTKLSIDEQNKVMTLYDMQSPKTIYGIMITNALGADGENMMLCQEASRFNHSCIPNVGYAFSDPYVRFFAKKDIKCGEELCISYKDPFSLTSERQKHLLERFHFTCTCIACSLPADERKARDKTSILYQILEDQRVTGFESVKDIIMVIKKLDLLSPCMLARYCYEGFMVATVRGLEKEAKKWAKVVYEANLIQYGPNHEKVRESQTYLRNPRLHQNWNRQYYFNDPILCKI